MATLTEKSMGLPDTGHRGPVALFTLLTFPLLIFPLLTFPIPPHPHWARAVPAPTQTAEIATNAMVSLLLCILLFSLSRYP